MVYRDYTKTLLKPGNRTEPKADGNDTCTNALIPTIEQLNKVLWDNHFTVINCILNSLGYGILQDKVYRDLFASLFVTYHQAVIPEEGVYLTEPDGFNFTVFAKSMHDFIKHEVMSCDWEDPIGYNTLGL